MVSWVRKQVSSPVLVLLVALFVVQLVFVNGDNHARKMVGYWSASRRINPNPPPPPNVDKPVSMIQPGGELAPSPGPSIP